MLLKSQKQNLQRKLVLVYTSFAADIADLKYKNSDLVEGWLIENEEQEGQVNWKMRELEDC